MKQNIVRTVFLVLILQGLTVPSDAQPTDSRSNPEDIVGIYGASDGLVSTEITIKSDGTFSFYGEGCVSPSVTEGTWHLVSPGLIVTNSEGSQPSSEIRAEIDSNRKETEVAVMYRLGQLPGAAAIVKCTDGTTHRALSDKDGLAVLDFCPVAKITVSFPGFETAELSPGLEMANRFSVTMRESVFLLKDQLWCVYQGNLYRLENPMVRK